MTEFDSTLLRDDEKIIYTLRSIYNRYGYSQYKMSQFEEYDFYVKNKDFLVSDRMITFTDTNGRLMALKPDVTLSIIKSSKDIPGQVQKLYYNENVFRTSEDSGSFKEIMQIGLECIGDTSGSDISEVVKLAALSLKAISSDCVLEISHLGVIASIIDSLDISSESRSGLLRCVSEKNIDTLCSICSEENVDPSVCTALSGLTLLYEPFKAAVNRIMEITAPLTDNKDLESAISELSELINSLSGDECEDIIRIGFSVTTDLKYYNGFVFNGFIRSIPQAVLSGGQYDRLMKKIGRTSKAIGFAVYQDALESLDEIQDFEPGISIVVPKEKEFLNIALPKGRLGEKVYEMFAASGYECPSILESNRKLIFENEDRCVRYFWAKPSDVQIYVERGAADIGVVGKDIILEYEPDIYELLDLGIGKCRMCVAAPKGFMDNKHRTLKVATKFANIARNYYSSVDRDIDIVHLNGSIEIAPILGLTDVIVDIVETGTTLRENNLEVIEQIVPISARLIANKASFSFNSEKIMKIMNSLNSMIKGEDL